MQTRRVKCDEQVPCTACRTHKVKCSLERPGRGKPGKSLETSLPSPVKHHMRSKRNNAHGIPVSGPKTNSFPEACTTTGFAESCLLDLELMHHFTTKTCTMGPHVLDPSVFKEELPRLGLRYPYLLHQLLALSAFHCAYLRTTSRERYLLHGSEHQTQAVSGMRSALAGKMTEESSFALFMTSALLMTSSFASHLQYKHNDVTPLAGMLDIMALVRGLSAIKTTTHAELQFNILDKLKHHNGSQSCWKALDAFKTQLTILRSRISNLTGVDNATLNLLNKGAQSMLDCAEMPATAMTGELNVVFTWLCILPGDFFTLMQARHPGAMVVLLYYVVALREVETQCWVLEGWSAQLTSNIVDILFPPWTGLAQWAMDELGYSGSNKIA